MVIVFQDISISDTILSHIGSTLPRKTDSMSCKFGTCRWCPIDYRLQPRCVGPSSSLLSTSRKSYTTIEIWQNRDIIIIYHPDIPHLIYDSPPSRIDIQPSCADIFLESTWIIDSIIGDTMSCVIHRGMRIIRKIEHRICFGQECEYLLLL